MSVRRKTGSKPLAFITSLMVLFALVVPFIGVAAANHDRNEGITRLDAGADDSAPAGTCNSFTVQAFGNPNNTTFAEFETIDIRATQQDNNDILRDIEIAFCDPDGNGPGSNLTGGEPTQASGQQTGTDPNVAQAGRDCDDDAPVSTDGTDGGACTGGNGTAELPASIHDECVTDSNGQCTFGIISNEAGTMNVQVFSDTGEDVPNGGAVGTPDDDIRNGAEPFDNVVKTWTAGAGTARTITCEPTSDFNPEGTRHEFRCTVTGANGQVVGGETVTFDVTAGPNSQEVGPTVCGGAVGGANATSTSPAGSTTNNQGQTAAPAPEQTTGGQSNTADANQPAANRNTAACGYDDNRQGADNSLPGTDTIVAYVNLPQQPGGTAPTAGVDSGEPSVTITKTWVGPSRTIDCEPETATNQVGTTHTITCTVRDRAGNPAQGVLVDLTIQSGPGAFQGTTTDCRTNAAGQCTGTLSTNQDGATGTTVVRGEIENSGANAANRTECSRVAGDPSGAPAGVCVDEVQKTWTRQGPAQCNNGVDDDGDGRIDFGQDPGCADINDNTESPDPGTVVACNNGIDDDGDGLVDHPNDPGCVAPNDTSEVDGGGDGDPRRVATNLTIRYNKAANAFKGAVGASRKPCQVGRRVTLKKVVPGPNRTVGRDTSNRFGNWQINKRTRRGRYYAVVSRQTETARNGTPLNCLRDRSVTIKLRRR